MMKRRAFVLALAMMMFVGLSALEAQEWAGRGRLQGIVTDADTGKPIRDAKVTLKFNNIDGAGPSSDTTNKRGRWGALGLATGNWTILIEAEGYVVSEGQARVAEGAVGPGQTLRVQIRKVPEQVEQVADDGPDVRGMLERGNVLMNQGKYADSRAEYQNALAELTSEESKKSHPMILLAIAQTYAAEQDEDSAIQTLEQILTLDPENQDALKVMSSILVNQGKEAEAQAYLERIQGDFKVDPSSLLNLGIQAYNEGDIDKASGYFERVVADYPELPDGLYYRGLVYLNKGNTEGAKADFLRLIEVAPDHPKAAEAKEFAAAL
ncbi:MAG: tetratricopeptide repeat protein [Acidobacteriota bacterium]